MPTLSHLQYSSSAPREYWEVSVLSAKERHAPQATALTVTWEVAAASVIPSNSSLLGDLLR